MQVKKSIIIFLSLILSVSAFALTPEEQKARQLVHAIMSKGVSVDYAKGLSYTNFERRGKCLIYLEAEHNGAFQGGYLVDICKNKATGTN
jgi:hypothetical protein